MTSRKIINPFDEIKSIFTEIKSTKLNRPKLKEYIKWALPHILPALSDNAVQLHFAVLYDAIIDDSKKMGYTGFLNLLIDYANDTTTYGDWLALIQRQRPTSLPHRALAAFSSQDIEKISLLQNHWRSKKRKSSHPIFFNNHPPVINPLINLRDEKLTKFIKDASLKLPVISNEVYHWTIDSNLIGILREGYLFGNAQLTNHNLIFEKNALESGDIENGDGQSICFAPYFLDNIALIKGSHIRPGLIRLTLDLNEIPKKISKYNQFFKLFDFFAPYFKNILKFSEDFSCEISKIRNDNRIKVCFKFKKNKEKIFLEKEEAIFYGNLHTVNQFCLSQFFVLVKKLENTELKNDILDYTKQLPADKLLSFLIYFSKNLVIFSEYNFNAALKITPNLIKEIYFVNENQLLKLDKYTQEEKIECFKKFMHDPSPERFVTEKPNYKIITNDNYNLQLFSKQFKENDLVADFSSKTVEIKSSPYSALP